MQNRLMKQNNLESITELYNSNNEAKAFDLFRRGLKIPFNLFVVVGVKSTLRETFFWFINHIPGPIGIKMRTFVYGMAFKQMGRNCLIDYGVRIDGPENISIADYVWIDRYVSLYARFGSISIGRRVHIATYSLISGGGGVYIGDYVGISHGVKIYSHSEAPRDGKRMSGPMMLDEFEGQIIKPVVIEKDAFLGSNAVILPGVTIGEGAVVAANSLITRNVDPYDIVMGVPAKCVGKRGKVVVDEI